jgi:hypothetical protein
MNHEIDPFSEFQFVIPSGELIVARVTPEWTVEANDKVQEYVPKDSAICLSALACMIDTLNTNSQISDAVIEISNQANRLGAIPNQVVQDGKVRSSKIKNALIRLVYPTESLFRLNVFSLSTNDLRRIVFLSNTADDGHGFRVIDNYAEQNNLPNSQKIEYLESFRGQFSRRDTSRRLQIQPLPSEPKNPKVPKSSSQQSQEFTNKPALEGKRKIITKKNIDFVEKLVRKPISDSAEQFQLSKAEEQAKYVEFQVQNLLMIIETDGQIDMESFIEKQDMKGYSGLVEKEIYNQIRSGVLKMDRVKGRKTLLLEPKKMHQRKK